MPRTPKGLRDIKTPLMAHKLMLRMNMSIETINRTTHLRQTTQRQTQRELKRAWLFTPEPNFARYQQNLHVQKVEQPHLDVFNEVNSLILVAQIPGANEKAIQIEINGDVLRLEADAMTRNGHIKYYKEILLPFEVDISDLSSSYKDGIFQLELNRPRESEK
ncbi:MAG TPA: Hsp20/alpha crystallin family protein [Candidatus Hypogeohydataceae bacterium YC41]